jgi:hypothetical protein
VIDSTKQDRRQIKCAKIPVFVSDPELEVSDPDPDPSPELAGNMHKNYQKMD